MAWTLYLLSQNPDATGRLEAELDEVVGDGGLEVADLPQLVYCRAVFLEAMRLYPPAWSMFRTAIDDDVLGGHRIPAGTMVMLAQCVTHRHPAFWASFVLISSWL